MVFMYNTLLFCLIPVYTFDLMIRRYLFHVYVCTRLSCKSCMKLKTQIQVHLHFTTLTLIFIAWEKILSASPNIVYNIDSLKP